jgi:dsDNA-binding SOS-regulon protein
MQQMTIWKTSDGSTFERREEADRHERFLGMMNRIDQYLSTVDFAVPRSETTLRNRLAGLAAWLADEGMSIDIDVVGTTEKEPAKAV